MANIARLVAMESIFENIAGKLVVDVKEGNLPMSDAVLSCMETIVEAARKTQIVRELMEEQNATQAQNLRMVC